MFLWNCRNFNKLSKELETIVLNKNNHHQIQRNKEFNLIN